MTPESFTCIMFRGVCFVCFTAAGTESVELLFYRNTR